MNIINALQNHWFFLALFSGIFGLLIGSFLNVVIYRLPIMLKTTWILECSEFLKLKHLPKNKQFNLFLPRSHCPKCKKLIPFYSNIPLISFIVQQGKCNVCGVPISWRYPLVELLSASVTVFICLHFGLTLQTILLLTLSWTLLAAIFIDIDHQILPDSLTLPLLWLGLLANAFSIFVTPQAAIIGAIIGYSGLWIIASAFKIIRKIDGMGHGDFKLFAVFGAWFGWKLLPITILLASLAGTVIGIIWLTYKKYNLQKPIPFGPFIAIAGWITLFWGETILHWYTKLFGF